MIEWLATEHPDPEGDEPAANWLSPRRWARDARRTRDQLRPWPGRVRDPAVDPVGSGSSGAVAWHRGTECWRTRTRECCRAWPGYWKRLRTRTPGLRSRCSSGCGCRATGCWRPTGMVEFLGFALLDGFRELRPFVARMIRSDVPEVGESGAVLACLAVLHGHDDAERLVDEALGGGEPLRLGVAKVAAHNVNEQGCRDWCEAKLRVLFADDSTCGPPGGSAVSAAVEGRTDRGVRGPRRRFHR